MRVLIIPDKFKGTLAARQAAAAMGRGWKRVRPQDQLDLLPMSDGGDGFGEVMSALLGARERFVRTVDAAHRPLRARWWWEEGSRTAIVDTAGIIGLAMLPPRRFHPFQLDTTGLGRVLAAVARLNPRRCFIGVGGSATNDGGFGLARALGWRFLTREGSELGEWQHLAHCKKILPPGEKLRIGRLTVALDVVNPLLGTRGCTRVYGPQKGLRPEDFPAAEAALRTLSRIAGQVTGTAAALIPGAGAAGGLGFGLMTFLRAQPMPGFSIFAREARLEARIRAADRVITGEGRFDRQSLMGKGVGELLSLCNRWDVPCVVIAGSVPAGFKPRKSLAGLYALDQITSAGKALHEPLVWLSDAAARAAAGPG